MVAVYAGFPAALEAWPVMEEVFAARGLSGRLGQGVPVNAAVASVKAAASP